MCTDQYASLKWTSIANNYFNNIVCYKIINQSELDWSKLERIEKSCFSQKI